LLSHARLISSGIAPNVGDPYIDIFNEESFIQRVLVPNFPTVDVSVYRSDNRNRFNFSHDLRISYVTGVPDLIGLLTISEYFLIDIPMRV